LPRVGTLYISFIAFSKNLFCKNIDEENGKAKIINHNQACNQKKKLIDGQTFVQGIPGGIKCLAGTSIPCRPVTSDVSPNTSM
jgi:hypothetical protein